MTVPRGKAPKTGAPITLWAVVSPSGDVPFEFYAYREDALPDLKEVPGGTVQRFTSREDALVAALLLEAIVANRDLDGDLCADEMGDLDHARKLIVRAQRDGWMEPSDYVALWRAAKAADVIRRSWAFDGEPDSRQWPEEAALYRALEDAGFIAPKKRNGSK